MSSSQRFLTISIALGVAIPALLSLFFVYQFGIRTIYWDEWEIVPNIKLFLTGEPSLQNLIVQHNEHRPFFPRLIILGMAYLTSYNTFYEILMGWTFLSLALFIIWRLLRRTVSEATWVIVPIAWIGYSLSQYESLLWGFTSISWYLTILTLIATVYFLHKIKESPISIVPAIIFGCIASFSSVLGLLVWPIGIFSFRNFRDLRSLKLRLLVAYVIAGVTAYVTYFNGWQRPTYHPDPLLFLSDPIGFANYILVFLGNGLGIGARVIGLDALITARSVGIVMVFVFIMMNLLYFYSQIRHNENHNITSWLQIALFGLLSVIVTGIGRFGFGVEQALAPRYVPLSNVFLEATIVITVVVLLYITRVIKTPSYRKILKGFGAVLMILLGINIGLSYIDGWIEGSGWSEGIATGASCLMTFESAPDYCLRILYPNTEVLKERARMLQELCLGPFTTSKCR